MLTLAEVRDWLKTVFVGVNSFYIGKLENKKEKSIGVYQFNTEAPIINLGKHNAYSKKTISVLVHWNNNAKDTEEQAITFYNALNSTQNKNIGDFNIELISLLTNEPIDVGIDELTGVYERVIQFEIYYN